MFIQTETTPNPLTLKFIPGVPILESGTAFFTTPEDATISPLAVELFAIEGVNSIFLSNDFITITKNNEADWKTLKAPLLTSIMDFFMAKKTVMLSEGNALKTTRKNEEDSDIVKQIRELIETRVRPAVAGDGGDIIFHSFEYGIVRLELHGSCSGCPSSTITLKNGVENMLKHYIPEIIAVEAI